ncbi:MAG: phosphoglycerate kinase [Nitrospiraceae bacterium]|nr:MAG: phosphoglycerate kinase [Nitrospiraceae bacterium]
MSTLDPRLPVIQNAPLENRVVLVRFDHNVVKSGQIRDPYRIDMTLGTLYNIVERGGRPILMTHVGRPRDKKTGEIFCRDDESVRPIVEYLERKLHINFHIPEFTVTPQQGIIGLDTSINHAIRDLRKRKIGGIYLPNTRWFQGEEGTDTVREHFALQLAGLADIFINDAFGSWQPHVSTFNITKYLPSFAGFLMQQEIVNVHSVINPERPFVAVIAGAKYDTKIKPLYALYDKVDKLILGGVIYNTYLCAKYDIKIAGVQESDVKAAQDLVEKDRRNNKIIELPYLIESETIEAKIEGKYRSISTKKFERGKRYQYVLDIDPQSFTDDRVYNTLSEAKTIFVNAVMGYTPQFAEGSASLDRTIDLNRTALKMYGGGDTLQEFKDLCPGLYLSVLDNTQYYFFTGGGTVLTAIEQGSPYGLQPVEALIENGGVL